jgi:hypothetical protein
VVFVKLALFASEFLKILISFIPLTPLPAAEIRLDNSAAVKYKM